MSDTFKKKYNVILADNGILLEDMDTGWTEVAKDDEITSTYGRNIKGDIEVWIKDILGNICTEFEINIELKKIK